MFTFGEATYLGSGVAGTHLIAKAAGCRAPRPDEAHGDASLLERFLAVTPLRRGERLDEAETGRQALYAGPLANGLNR